MSTFNPQMPMPLDLLAYKNQIEKNRGFHVNFPYGIAFPLPHINYFEGFDIPTPLYLGLTVRAFYYAPEKTSTYSEFRLVEKTYVDKYYTGTIVSEDKIYVKYLGYNLRSVDHGDIEKDITLAIPGYYSVGLRFMGGYGVGVFFRDKELRVIYHIRSESWVLWVKGGVHHILSVHLSDEGGDKNPSFPKTNLGQYYPVLFPKLGAGSYCVLDCIAVEPKQDAVIFLKRRDKGWTMGKGGDYGTAIYKMKNVKRRQLITFYIRSSRGHWLVTASFDSTATEIDNSVADTSYATRIDPWVSDNLEIVRQYYEPGPQIYF